MATRNFREMLENKWSQGRFVCVGLDSESAKIPKCIRGSVAFSISAFNHDIVKATRDLVCAYKPNSAFYEAQGSDGLLALRETINHIRDLAPDVPIILDAKRADIGNTNAGYVAAAFDFLDADAITVHPYLGAEALRPFLEQKDKGIFVLCRTSNPGAGEFQDLQTKVDSEELERLLPGNSCFSLKQAAGYPHSPPYYLPLYQQVAARVARDWNVNGNCGLVVGATYASELAKVRAIVGDMPILIPGVGAQGGIVEETVKAGKYSRGWGMIINSSRGIIFASAGEDFAEAARRETEKLHHLINQYL